MSHPNEITHGPDPMTTDRNSGRPKFGDWLRGIHASEDNPQRDGMFVREVVTPRGRMNSGTAWELTDGKGDFWRYPPHSVKPLPTPPASIPAAEVQALVERWGQREIACGEAGNEWEATIYRECADELAKLIPRGTEAQ